MRRAATGIPFKLHRHWCNNEVRYQHTLSIIADPSAHAARIGGGCCDASTFASVGKNANAAGEPDRLRKRKQEGGGGGCGGYALRTGRPKCQRRAAFVGTLMAMTMAIASVS